MDFLDSAGGLVLGYVVMAAIGLVLGGFISRATFRIPAEKPVLKPGPMCLNCETPIAFADRLPIVGYFIVGGKCRSCGEKISPLYPAIEIVTPLLLAAVFWRFGWSIAMPVYAAFAASMVLVTFVDLIDWTIPDEVSIPGIFIGIAVGVVAMALPDSGLQIKYLYTGVFDAIGGAILGGVMLIAIDQLALLLVKKKGMGFGDVKLNAMIGAFIGYKGVLLSFILACLIGSVIGVAMVAINRNKEGGDNKPGAGNYLPFGPYLAIGGLIVIFFGAEIADVYINDWLPSSSPY